MARRRTDGRVTQPFDHGFQSSNQLFKFVRLCDEQVTVDVGLAVRREHETDLVKRKAGRLTQCNQRQLIQYGRRETSTRTRVRQRADQSAPLVVA